jgi:methyl acetate hydrolase
MNITTSLNGILSSAVKSGQVPPVAAIAVDNAGVIYKGEFGPSRIDREDTINSDAIFQLHSMTKAITGTGCMQLVEQGRISLDDDCGPLVPALSNPRVLIGFEDDGKPITRPAKGAITLRRLLTHTAGFVYEQWNPGMNQWMNSTGIGRSDFYKGSSTCPPLGFDPGERWEYGINIDWAGKVLEAVTNQTLDAYLNENVLTPLGMKSTGFVPTGAQRTRMVGVHQRLPDGIISPVDFEHPRSAGHTFTGGGGMFGSADDYGRFMRMLLNRGSLDGVQVLRPDTVDLMGQNHIGDLVMTGLPTTRPDLTNAFDFFPEVVKKWGLTFMITSENMEGRRRAGSLSWAGLRNSYFWVDPASGIGGAIFFQLLPFADKNILDVYDTFERGLYAALRKT